MTDHRYQLFLVSKPEVNERWDFDLLARYVSEGDPEIAVSVVGDTPSEKSASAQAGDRPTMTFSPAPIAFFRPGRGRVFQGRALTKSQEYEALARVGVRVPRSAVLTPDRVPDLTDFGPYVVLKPERGGRGADVKIVRKGRVRWRPPKTELARTLGGPGCPWIVQDFIYPGPYPVSHRVASLFGEPIWGWTTQASTDRRPLKHRYDFHDGEGGGGMSIVSSGKGCRFAPLEDREVMEVARLAHQAMSSVPLIGVDVIRDAETNELFVIEVNAIGLTWHLTSPVGRRIQDEFGFDLDRCFDARRTAARVLAEQVRRHAA
jgi:hypothetical protein